MQNMYNRHILPPVMECCPQHSLNMKIYQTKSKRQRNLAASINYQKLPKITKNLKGKKFKTD